jgi:hypothetical protein
MSENYGETVFGSISKRNQMMAQNWIRSRILRL